MKLLVDFEIVDLDDEIVAVPVGANADTFHGVLKINETAKAILSYLKNDTSEDQIVAGLLKEYDSSVEEIAPYVHDYIDQLRKINLISE